MRAKTLGTKFFLVELAQPLARAQDEDRVAGDSEMRVGCRVGVIISLSLIPLGCAEDAGSPGEARAFEASEDMARYDPARDEVLAAPVITVRTAAEMAADEAAISSTIADRYVEGAWRARVAEAATTLGAPIYHVALVHNVRSPVMTTDGQFELTATVTAANLLGIPADVQILQHALAGQPTSEWRLRVPATDRNFMVLLIPTAMPGTFQLLVDFDREVVGFGIELEAGSGIYKIPGGPEEFWPMASFSLVASGG